MDKEPGNDSTINIKRKYDSETKNLLNNEECSIQYGGVSKNTEDNTSVDSSKNQSTCRKICEILLSLTIEPVMFIFMFTYMCNLSVLSNMMMDKGCLYYYNYSAEICKNLSAHETEKTNVEVLSSNYSIYSNLLNLIGAFLMIFIATWSDKYGRKPFLMLALFGALLTDLGYILCTVFFDSRLIYVVISELPKQFAGGFICIFSILFSLASELSSLKNRSLKYNSVEIFLGLGIALGGLTGGMLYEYYGYIHVYSLSAILHALGCFWVIFIVEETRGLDVNMKWHEKAKDFFVFTNFSNNFTATFKQRPGNTRTLLLLLILSMCVIVLNYESFSSIAYVYVHHIFNWNPTNYNLISTSSTLIILFLNLILVPVFIKVLKINDFTLGILGSVSLMSKNLLISFSKDHVYLYYAGLASGVFIGLSNLAIRTGVSKLVDKDEIGRVFAFLATCETILPMIGTVLVTKLFSATMDSYPNVAYLATVFCLIIPLVTFIYALKSTKHSYRPLDELPNDSVREKV